MTTQKKIYCPSTHNNWCCTLEDGHKGDHVAGGTQGKVYDQWPQEPKLTPFEIEFIRPTEKQHSVLLTLEDLKILSFFMSRHGVEQAPETAAKIDKALKDAL